MSDHASSQSQSAPSRRQFLGRTAGAAVVGSLALARSAHAAGSDAIRIGLVGCGGRGSGAVVSALNVNPAAKLTAMADAFSDRIELARASLRRRLGDRAEVADSHCYAGFDAYKQLLASGVDMVILAEAPHFRPQHLQACVDAGVHVFSEKPMAVDAPGVRRVLAAGEKARAQNTSFVSGFETRYGDTAREAIQRLRDGAIGDVVTIEGRYNTGFLWHRGHEPEWTEMEYQMRNWYYFTWLSGDHNVEQHVHFMDVVGWIMNEQPPKTAWGYGGRSVRTESKWGNIFDHHAVVYEYEGGPQVYALTRQQTGCYNEVSYMVTGTKGRLTKGRNGWGSFRIEGETNWEGDKPKEHPELNTFREMFAGMAEGRPINDSLSMARSTMLAVMGRMATYSGQLVTWDECYNSDLVLAPARYAWDAEPPAVPDENGVYPHAIPGQTKAL